MALPWAASSLPLRGGKAPVIVERWYYSAGGSLSASNLSSTFGYGHSYWVWGDHGVPQRFGRGAEPSSSAFDI
jgi:hypothetical protein